MVHKFLVSAFFLALAQSAFNQKTLPVIKSSSRTVDIRDGLHFKKGYWYIMPEKKPDYYFVEIPSREHRVTFITDSDSISFDTKYGQEYDFIVLLKNKDSCHTRIVCRYNKIVQYTTNQLPATNDTIPFTIGNNSKIYFKGRVNNSVPLNIQFDLGSGGCLVKKSSIQKVNMKFDGSITLTNSDGTHVVSSSSSNKLQVANLTWDSIPFAVADNMTSKEDLLVGNYLFQNKVIEIDYDKRILIIHDTLPPADFSYSKHDIILDGVVPYVKAILTTNSSQETGWFMFDTGAYTTILQTGDLTATHKMYVEAKKMIGLEPKNAGLLSPHLAIGTYTFSDFNYATGKQGGDRTRLGLLGNDLLKRFNVLLDNRNGHIYLKPNSLINEPYANPEYYLVRIIGLVLILLITLPTLIFYLRRRKRRRMLAPV